MATLEHLEGFGSEVHVRNEERAVGLVILVDPHAIYFE